MILFDEKTYKVLKWIAIIFLPSLTTFVGVVMNCLDVPNTDTVITIMTAFDSFLGIIIGVSTSNYNNYT